MVELGIHLEISAPLRGGAQRRQVRGQCQAGATHVGLNAEKVEAILVDGKDAGGQYGNIATALDEEEGGAKHG